MAELYRHTDADGRTLTFMLGPVGSGELIAWTGKDGAVHGDRAIRLPESEARLLLAALLNYYGSEEITKEERRA